MFPVRRCHVVAPAAPHTGAFGRDCAAAAAWKSSAEIPSAGRDAAAKWTRLSRLEILPLIWKSAASLSTTWNCSSADRPEDAISGGGDRRGDTTSMPTVSK